MFNELTNQHCTTDALQRGSIMRKADGGEIL